MKKLGYMTQDKRLTWRYEILVASGEKGHKNLITRINKASS